MPITDSLQQIRQIWLNRVSNRLARGEGVRESFRQQLGVFFELLTQAVETGDPGWLDSLILEWANARTESELENRESSLPPILNQILQITCEVARENLVEAEALDLIEGVLPVYTHAMGVVQRKEAELQFAHMSRELERAKLALERLDKNKSDFISIAAHELKTPMTLIEGYAAMLREHLPEQEDNSRAEVLLQGVHKGTRRLREIIDDMIDVSMIDNRLLALNFQPVWINSLLSMIQQELAGVIEERRQTLEIIPFPGIDEMTFGDGERLYQALRNVVANAVKFTPDGGKITASGRLLPGFIEVTIHDNGIGIDPEDHTWVFEKFGSLGDASLHSSGKSKFKGGGPGLGLPITKGVIDAHGGAIWVESEGRDEVRCPGTTFHILLPVRKNPPGDCQGKFSGMEAGKRRNEEAPLAFMVYGAASTNTTT